MNGPIFVKEAIPLLVKQRKDPPLYERILSLWGLLIRKKAIVG